MWNILIKSKSLQKVSFNPNVMKLPPFLGLKYVTMKWGFYYMKYSMKEKLKIVKEHLEEGVPLHELDKKYNYHYTNIKYQCALYRMYGEKAFEDHGTSRTYTREDKLKAIDRVLNGKESRRQVALSLMLTDPKIVNDWVSKYQKEGEASIKDTHSRTHYLIHEERLQVEANKKLLERLEYLEAENEYLKKSYALIQKREQQKKNKS